MGSAPRSPGAPVEAGDGHRSFAQQIVEQIPATVCAKLIDMATSWLKLAEQAEKNSRTDLTYETPPRRE